MNNKIKVLIVDDSALMRKLLSVILSSDPEIEIVGTAINGVFALKKIPLLNPDVVTLDIEMPEINGIETLKKIMKDFPRPVVMISSFTDEGTNSTFKALELGAVDFITKPESIYSEGLDDIKRNIIHTIKSAFHSKSIQKTQEIVKTKIIDSIKFEKTKKIQYIVSIGISTGGPDALKRILPLIPKNIPASFVIVQHMPVGFTKAFAERMNSLSEITIKEAEEGDILKPGTGFIARGDRHLVVTQKNNVFMTHLKKTEKVSGFMPSIDVLMESVAKLKRKKIGVIMTGMARDGVNGITMIKQNKGITIAQDKKSSIVFGMNRLAIESGNVDYVLPLENIVPKILEIIRGKNEKSKN